MIYSQQQPHENLCVYIMCYWKIENKDNDFLSYTLFPDSFFDLLICYHNDKLDRIYKEYRSFNVAQKVLKKTMTQRLINYQHKK